MDSLPGYDAWKTQLPDDESECTCLRGLRRHRFTECPVHGGPDPDDARDRMIEDREFFRNWGDE